MRRTSFLITGTDTGVGKTTVACAIAAAFYERGVRVGVAKPFETGCDPGPDGLLVAADAVQLQYFSGCPEPIETICPYRFRDSLAPSAAARREGRIIDLAVVARTIGELTGRYEMTLIEGAGGLLVPVVGQTTFADLAREWSVPLIIVVGNRLGALNHAQLTIHCARGLGLSVAGYVVNALSPKPDHAAATNVEMLAELLGPPLGVFPWVGTIARTPADRACLAEVAEHALDLSALTGASGTSRED